MNAHDVQFGSFGPVVVGLFGSSLLALDRALAAPRRSASPGSSWLSNAQPWPPMVSGSAASSFSSVTTMIGEQRVGPQEVGALLEDGVVDALERGALPFFVDLVERIGLDEEAVPGLVLRLEAAAVLVHALDERREVA